MRIVDLLKKQSIDLNASVADKAAAIDHLVDLMAAGGNLNDKELYREYREWCAENGYTDSKNVNRFKNDMEFAGVIFKKSIKFADGSVTSGYILYQILDRGDDDDLPMTDEEKRELAAQARAKQFIESDRELYDGNDEDLPY